MRRLAIVLVAALGSATVATARPPIATPADSALFAANCDRSQPRATCICVVNKLQRSLEGQITLDSYALSVRYEGSKIPDSTVLALLNRYNLKVSEFKAIADGAEALARASVAGCR